MMHRSKPSRRAIPSPWLAWQDELIGQMADVEVAAATGHSAYAVERRRYVLGLSRFQPCFVEER